MLPRRPFRSYFMRMTRRICRLHSLEIRWKRRGTGIIATSTQILADSILTCSIVQVHIPASVSTYLQSWMVAPFSQEAQSAILLDLGSQSTNYTGCWTCSAASSGQGSKLTGLPSGWDIASSPTHPESVAKELRKPESPSYSLLSLEAKIIGLPYC